MVEIGVHLPEVITKFKNVVSGREKEFFILFYARDQGVRLRRAANAEMMGSIWWTGAGDGRGVGLGSAARA